MSSLVCNTTHCIFTRVDTNGTAAYPYQPHNAPAFDSRNDFNLSLFNASPVEPVRVLDTVEGVFTNPAFDDDDFNFFPYAKSSRLTSYPWTDPENQDKLSDTVALTRDFRSGLFNAVVSGNDYGFPDIQWAMIPEGKTFEEARCSMVFCQWSDCFMQRYRNEQDYIGKPGVIYLVKEDVYYNIMLTNWTPNYLPCKGCLIPKRSKNRLGGGFSYVRDATPISFKSLPPCPKCNTAKADPAVIRGPNDDGFVNVTITGVSPADAVIAIKAIAQSKPVKCNSASSGKDASLGQVRPNSKFDVGSSFAQLRRTRTPGELNPFFYQVYFDATSEAGTCSGQVSVCVPVEGFDCNTYLGYDSKATQYCDYSTDGNQFGQSGWSRNSFSD